MVWTFMKERGLKTAFGGKVSVETPCKADPNSKSKPGLRKPWQHLSKQWCEFQKKIKKIAWICSLPETNLSKNIKKRQESKQKNAIPNLSGNSTFRPFLQRTIMDHQGPMSDVCCCMSLQHHPGTAGHSIDIPLRSPFQHWHVAVGKRH